jgi:hypothetical protein
VIEQNVVTCAAVLCVALHELLYIVLLVDIEKISEDSLNLLLSLILCCRSSIDAVLFIYTQTACQFYLTFKPDDIFFCGMQLRNLVWATSKHDVYLVSNYSIMHWSSLSGNLSEIINFAGHVAPTEVLQSNLLRNVFHL